MEAPLTRRPGRPIFLPPGKWFRPRGPQHLAEISNLLFFSICLIFWIKKWKCYKFSFSVITPFLLELCLSRYAHAIQHKILRILTPSNTKILKIQNVRPKVGPLTPYKPPFNPINRPWDLSRSIDLEEIYILVDLELHGAYLKANSCLDKVHVTSWPFGPL